MYAMQLDVLSRAHQGSAPGIVIDPFALVVAGDTAVEFAFNVHNSEPGCQSNPDGP